MNSKRNLLIMSKLGGGIAARLLRCSLLLLIVSAALGACSKPKPADAAAVDVPASLFHNHDSVLYYAEKAYLHDDPKGCFVVGACYYLRRQGDLPEEFYVVSHEEADDFLMLSAGQGYQPAKDLIHCLEANNQWYH